MTFRSFSWICDAIFGVALGILLPPYIKGDAIYPSVSRLGANSSAILSAALLYFFGRLIESISLHVINRGKKQSIYGLEHGRLHLRVPTPMWMNMGYWGKNGTQQSLAEACRDLLERVLREAGIESNDERAGAVEGMRRKRMLIDVGFGCGEQTVYLMSNAPVRSCDKEWWNERPHTPRFDHYIGITNDPTQHRYASTRIQEVRSRTAEGNQAPSTTSLFCADASKPASWNASIKKTIDDALEDDPERWVLALDTAYHFTPTRWALVKYAHEVQASFMAFDLCLSPTASPLQKLTLRILTALMRAPWANFVTPEDYMRKLVAIGYSPSAIKVVDVSDHVFAPLARYLEEQDARLKTLGLGIGAFGVAKSMFRWWGRSGVVRGIIVVAGR